MTRLAQPSDLASLLALFAASEVSAAVESPLKAQSIWQETLAHPGFHVFVSDDVGRIAATCMLITAPEDRPGFEWLTKKRLLRRCRKQSNLVSRDTEEALMPSVLLTAT